MCPQPTEGSKGGVPVFGDQALMLRVAFITSLVAFVIIALSVDEVDWLWALGLVLLVASLALAPLARFTAGGRSEGEGDDEDESRQDPRDEGRTGEEGGEGRADESGGGERRDARRS
ncbi:MAG: hypothetical protein JW767_08820 [Thermoleophilia bacterium]|nr:hypothetical protein [Thermoleophilia bacterium]